MRGRDFIRPLTTYKGLSLAAGKRNNYKVIAAVPDSKDELHMRIREKEPRKRERVASVR